ncbi:MAG: hypothetical protein U0359_17005 [Byssovorax sp.]
MLALLGVAGGCHDKQAPAACGSWGEPPCACAASRRRPTGLCCPTWTSPNNVGECVLRRWLRPSPDGALGAPGAILGQLLVDERGAGLLTLGIPTVDGQSQIEIGEERSPGHWVTRRPDAALSGRMTASFLAVGPASTAMLVWLEAVSDKGVYVSERDAHGAWKDPGSADSLAFPAGAVEPSIASSPAGEWLVTFCQATTTGWGTAIVRRRSWDSPWERPKAQDDVVSPNILFANAPLLALDARGDAMVTWYQSNTGPLMTYLSERRGTDGAFTHPGPNDFLSPPGAPVASGTPHNPMPAFGPHGEAAVVWSQEDGQGKTSLYLATRAADGPWKKPASLADAFSTTNGVTRGGKIAFGPAGELYVIWSQRVGERESVLFARRAPDGTWIDGGKSPVVISSPDALAYSPALAVGPDGGVATAWIETFGTKSRVVARRTGSDRRTFTAIEPLSDDALGNAGSPAIGIGPGDRALAGWTQGSIGKTRAYVAILE